MHDFRSRRLPPRSGPQGGDVQVATLVRALWQTAAVLRSTGRMTLVKCVWLWFGSGSVAETGFFTATLGKFFASRRHDDSSPRLLLLQGFNPSAVILVAAQIDALSAGIPASAGMPPSVMAQP